MNNSNHYAASSLNGSAPRGTKVAPVKRTGKYSLKTPELTVTKEMTYITPKYIMDNLIAK